MAVGNSMGIGIPMVNLGLGGGGGGGTSFLLDDYPNTIGHSYSLRKLSSTVTKVVRVRRSSDNTEQDFTATEITDGTLASFCGVGEGFVTKWYDQSNAIDIQNVTALQQPKIVSAGSVILENGKPCMEFDGVDDSLNFPLSGPSPVQYYLFAVNTYVSASLGSDAYMYGLSAPFPSPFTGPNSFRWSGTQGLLHGTSDLSFIQPSPFSQSLYYARQVAAGLPGTGSQIKINTTQHPILGGTNNGTTSINTIALGEKGSGGNNGNIKLQEFILYFADPITNETAIQSNINTHYSIY